MADKFSSNKKPPARTRRCQGSSEDGSASSAEPGEWICKRETAATWLSRLQEHLPRLAAPAGPCTDPNRELPSGGRWSRGEDLAAGGPCHTSPPASHGDRCIGAQLKLFPWGWGFWSPAGEEAKTHLEKRQVRICSPDGTSAVPGLAPASPSWHPGTAPSPPAPACPQHPPAFCSLAERRCSKSHSPWWDLELSITPSQAGGGGGTGDVPCSALK